MPPFNSKRLRKQLESAVETLSQASIALHEAARVQRTVADALNAKAEECRRLMHHLDDGEQDTSGKR